MTIDARMIYGVLGEPNQRQIYDGNKFLIAGHKWLGAAWNGSQRNAQVFMGSKEGIMQVG